MGKDLKELLPSLRSKVKIEVILNNKDNYRLDEFFYNLIIHKDKINLVKTLYKLNFNIPVDLIYEIQKAKDIKILLSLFTSNSESALIQESIIDRNFKKVLDIELIPFNKSSVIISENELKNIKQSQEMINSKLPFYFECFEKGAIETDKKLINNVFSNNTLKDISIYLIEKSIKTTNVSLVITPFENNESYHEVIIPPMPLFNCIKFLDNTFGIYSKQPILFYDNKKIYVIKSNTKVNLTDRKNT
jgi:hypothetical protein